MPANIPEGAHRIELPGSEYPELNVGKVRHTFDLGDGNLLMVASDRISTFDHVHPTPIPGKGKVLTQISAFWFKRLEDLGIQNHLISADTQEIIREYPKLAPYADILEGRTMLVRKQDVAPVEAIMRGNITGNAWKKYSAGEREMCGVALPNGMQESDFFKEPIFTPTTKSDLKDEDRTFDEVCAILEDWRREQGIERTGTSIAQGIRARSKLVFLSSRRYADQQGIIEADTKLEWGVTKKGELVLVDEVLTPDSSRYWPKADFKPGRSQKSADKQIVRDHAKSLGWDMKSEPAPEIAPEIVDQTIRKYLEVYEQLTGEKLAV